MQRAVPVNDDKHNKIKSEEHKIPENIRRFQGWQ